MRKITIKNINYYLSLYYSYLLPIFTIKPQVFVKDYGFCNGLKCIIKNNVSECLIPDHCSYGDLEKLLGLDKYIVIEKLFTKLKKYGFKTRALKGFTLLYSPQDKFFIASSIYLSRNTDYYRNTIRWIREIASRKCYIEPINCKDYTSSYQYREYLENIDKLYTIISNKHDPIKEVLELLKIHGFGIKSTMAYLLHTYGYLEYAPIDRYYRAFISKTGLTGAIPSKNKCIENKFKCSVCSYRDQCLYNILRNKLREYNGLLQSLIYIHGRLKKIKGKRPSSIEEILLNNINVDTVVSEIEDLISVFLEKKLSV